MNDMKKEVHKPVSAVIARNLFIARTHLRKMSLNRLADRTQTVGRRISQLNLVQIEANQIEITVDELWVLADALMVSPVFLVTDREAQALIEYQHSVDDALSVNRAQELIDMMK